MKNNRGMSIIMALAAGAVGLIILAGFVTMIFDLNKGAAGVKFKTESDILNDEIRANLSSSVACTNSFGGLLVGPSVSQNITNLFNGAPPPGAIKYTAGGIYGDQQ